MCDLSLRLSEAYGAAAYGGVQPVLDPVLVVIAGRYLGPQIGATVVASQLQRDEVVHLVTTRRVRFNPVLRVHTLLQRL